MAKMSYTKRFENFFNEIKANGEVIKYSTSFAIRISRAAFDKAMEAVSDFVNLDEYEECLKPYRCGTHYAHYSKNTNSYGNVEIIFTDDEQAKSSDDVELAENMVTDLRSFNNCGSFNITLEGTTYAVKYSNQGRRIDTNAPEHIKRAVEKWWFV